MLEELRRIPMICRLRFRKSLNSEYNKSVENISFQIEVSDEFEAVEAFQLDPDRVRVYLRRVNPETMFFDEYVEVVPVLKVGPNAKFVQVSLPGNSLSVDEGQWYQLKVSLDSVADEEQLVLPVFSDFFYVQPSSTSCDPNESKSSSTKRILCSNYREISFVNPSSTQPFTFVIKEDYGATIGSHVYDSSIVLGQYLFETLANPDKSCEYSTVIELGAGCGLISIAAASILQHFHPPSHSTPRVYATDRRSQLPLLQYNVERNPSTVHVTCCELDWDSRKQIQQFGQLVSSTTSSPSSTLILAADVLYDRDAAKSLHRLLLALHKDLVNISQRMDTWLVYKNRSNLSHDEVLAKVACWCCHGQHTAPTPSDKENHKEPQLQSQLLITAAHVYIIQLNCLPATTSLVEMGSTCNFTA